MLPPWKTNVFPRWPQPLLVTINTYEYLLIHINNYWELLIINYNYLKLLRTIEVLGNYEYLLIILK